MIKTINEKNLKSHLEKQVRIEREGITGNLFSETRDGRITAKEGVIFGILCSDEKGFYIRMYKSHWEDGYGLRVDKSSFLDEHYRIQNGDIIYLYTGERIVRLSKLER